MRSIVKLFQDGLYGILHTVFDSFIHFKIWIQELFQETPENQERFTTLNMVFYLNDNCKGYFINVGLYGVTDWQGIMDSLYQNYNLTMAQVCRPEARLDVTYSVLGRRYHVVYQNGNMQYPPYTIEELKEHNEQSTNLLNVLYAGRDEEDLTDMAIEYAGPKGNFYFDRAGLYIKENWIATDLTKERDEHLKVMDGEFKDYLFSDQCTIQFTEDHRVTPPPLISMEPRPLHESIVFPKFDIDVKRDNDVEMTSIEHQSSYSEEEEEESSSEKEEEKEQEEIYEEYNSDGFSILGYRY